MTYRLDGHKLLHHLDRLIPWAQGQEIYPLYLAFSPTNACQCSCLFCPFHSDKNKIGSQLFPWERFQTLVSELKKAGVKAIFFSGEGEPTLHPHFYQMVSLASEQGLAVALNTNLIHLQKDHSDKLLQSLSWLRVSLNATNAESYTKWQGSKKEHFEQVLENLKHLGQTKKNKNLKCTLGVQSLFLEQKTEELQTFILQLKELGIDYFSLKPYLKHPSSLLEKQKIPTSSELEKLEALSSSSFKVHCRQSFFEQGQRNYKHCHSFDFMCELGSDGELYSCGAMVGNKNFSYGSLLEQSFSDLWSGSKRKEVKKEIFKNHDVESCMPHCRHHAVNEWLWKYLDAPEHRNFI